MTMVRFVKDYEFSAEMKNLLALFELRTSQYDDLLTITLEAMKNVIRAWLTIDLYRQ